MKFNELDEQTKENLIKVEVSHKQGSYNNGDMTVMEFHDIIKLLVNRDENYLNEIVKTHITYNDFTIEEFNKQNGFSFN